MYSRCDARANHLCRSDNISLRNVIQIKRFGCGGFATTLSADPFMLYFYKLP